MKTLLSFMIFLVASTFQLFPQWNKLPVATDSDLMNLFFLTENIGWVVGNDATILKTTDGGITWIAQQPNIYLDFRSIYFVNEKTGWAGGSDGKFIKTTNGGENWNLLESPTDYSISSLVFIDEEHGYAAVNSMKRGRYGCVLETIDGGNVWCKSFETSGQLLIDVKFLDHNNGWVVGSNGHIVFTTNGGLNWEKQKTNTGHWLFSVFSLDGYKIWATGGGEDQDMILFSKDGGCSWRILRNSESNGRLTGSYFINNEIGWVCGKDGVILKTENGGYNWQNQISQSNYDLRKIIFSGNIGYAVGQRGTILKYHYLENEKRLEILSPNGNEELITGTFSELIWRSEGVVDVKIEYSYNNGASWNLVTASYPSSGIYKWKVPNIISNQTRIRIYDRQRADIFDENDDNFKIINPK